MDLKIIEKQERKTNKGVEDDEEDELKWLTILEEA